MTANQFGFICPGCGQGDEIDIQARVWVRLCADGTDITAARNGDHEWDDEGQVYCGICDFVGQVKDLCKHEEG